MKLCPYLVASVGTQLRVTRGLAMPQLRGGNGRSQEYLAFLLPLLHNGGRTPRRPQTRSGQFTFTVNDNFDWKIFQILLRLRCRKQFSRRLFSLGAAVCSAVSRPSAFRLRPSEPRILSLRTWRRRHKIDVSEKEKYFTRVF